MEEVTKENSKICAEESWREGKNSRMETGDDGRDLMDSVLKLEGKCDSKKVSTKPKSTRSTQLQELWTLVVNDWKNRDKVAFRSDRTAKKYGISKMTVWRIIKRFKEKGRVHRQSWRPRQESSERMKRLKEILEQEPSLSSGEVAKRMDLSRFVVRRMMRTYRDAAQNQVEAQSWTQDFQEASATAPPEDNNDNGCGWEGDDDLRGNVNRTPCFICDAVDKNVLDSTFPCGGMTSSSVPVGVERSVAVIWFLKDVLEMKDDLMTNAMKEARGRNPSEWEISVCTDPECGGVVERSFALWKQIKKLEAEQKSCRKGILERIRGRCSAEKGTAGASEDDDQALLSARVRERLERGMVESDTMELQEGPAKAHVKIEPRDEEFHDLDDFAMFGDSSNDTDIDRDLKVVKLEADDNGAHCRRSSRRKRKTDKFKYEKLGSGANSRAGAVPKLKGKSKLKGTKLGEEGNKEDKTAVRSGEKVYSCQSCPALEEMDKDKFIAHLGFHSMCPNKCTECNVHFPEGVGNYQVQSHWEERHPASESSSAKVVQVPAAVAAGNIWACSDRNCSELFGSAEERDGHELVVHGILEPKAKFRCSTCSLQFRDMIELRFHRAIEHPQAAMLSCCYCSIQFEINSGKDDIKFLNMDQLKQHISQKHPDRVCVNAEGERTSALRFLQTCPICGLVFNFVNYSKLDYHIAREHGHKLHETYTCPVCSRKMRYGDAWPHTKLRHWPDSPHVFPCRFCGKAFRRTFNRNEHEQIHKNKDTRPYQCDICGSSFAVRQYLKIHQRVSHERRPFPSALKKKQSRKNTSEVPFSDSGHCSKVTPNVVEAGPSESFVGPPPTTPHQHLLCDSFNVSLTHQS